MPWRRSLLSSFIGRRQSRMMCPGMRRDYLNLQVDLSAEKKLRSCCKKINWSSIYCDVPGLQAFVRCSPSLWSGDRPPVSCMHHAVS
jgi:hypothetical protein